MQQRNRRMGSVFIKVEPEAKLSFYMNMCVLTKLGINILFYDLQVAFLKKVKVALSNPHE
ncbi:hypothetical protein Fmac_027209 [Flemingia macrophylla]|uniref:Uncharacterized protein n=1 Tax=Flemingia macrophylla TaxID=520843 RepID=A0ABD1LH16_9FABA